MSPPSLSFDITKLLEQDLKEAWHVGRENEHRWNQKLAWATYDRYLTLIDGPDFYIDVEKLWNKPAAMYFEQSAQFGCHKEDRGHPCIELLFITTIYEAWRFQCGDQINIEFDHFTLQDIVEAHKRLSQFAKEHQSEDKNYRLQKTYPEVIMVCDRHEFGASQMKGGHRNLRKVAEHQTVLVVRTSHNESISFAKLMPHALPLERSDVCADLAVRVSFSIAIAFFVALERDMGEPQGSNSKDYDDKLSKQDVPDGFDRIVNKHPETWITAVLAKAEKGNPEYDILSDMEKAIKRVEACAAGKACPEYGLELDEWSRKWKSSYD
ncbi:hypothetical protein CC86DRAFT_470049 [Ophiobolus disseminans]|uniref:Uncharacterized protein n=1 Tax=Ophiobolus disseminans TaxID=1469910 RepID=A0A6A6ZLH7_9PLEO|nr:hypothetical protein CC86DRAFT_470049 [Ophiobolus disseminans]